MTELLTAAQMRAIEQAAIDSGEVTGLELMERAGQGVVDAIFEEWPELAERGASPPPSVARTDGANDGDCSPEYLQKDEGGRRAVVLCGPGNNGGDGFVVARLLHERGWDVEVFLYGDAEKLPTDARVNYERWAELGDVGDAIDFDPWSCEASMLIDGIFGTGLTRPPEGELSAVVRAADDARGSEHVKKRVAIDIPSGVCADSGLKLADERNSWPISDLTVSFHSEKQGHRLAQGPELCGVVRVADIGLLTNTKLSRNALADYHRLDGPPFKIGCVVAHLTSVEFNPFLPKETDNHKYTHGHALILSGGSGKTGAARLAARGALRIGAGLVTLGVPPSAQMEVASQITALMLTRVEGAERLAEVLEDARFNALCLGPGLGVERARELVPVVLGRGGVKPRPTVLDADALSAFDDDLEDLFAMLHEKCVLTPHGGEFARLFPDIAEKLNATPTKGPTYSKVDATREAAKRARCVVLFKGPDTVIAAPDGRCSINSAHYERAAPWLATAGSGDVLAGFITGLLARGFDPMMAAETAAYCHVECARAFGPGLIAEDLPDMLPQVFRDLGV